MIPPSWVRDGFGMRRTTARAVTISSEVKALGIGDVAFAGQKPCHTLPLKDVSCRRVIWTKRAVLCMARVRLNARNLWLPRNGRPDRASPESLRLPSELITLRIPRAVLPFQADRDELALFVFVAVAQAFSSSNTPIIAMPQLEGAFGVSMVRIVLAVCHPAVARLRTVEPGVHGAQPGRSCMGTS